MPLNIFNVGHTLIVFALPGIEVISNLLLQELSVSNGFVVRLDCCPFSRVQEVSIFSLHAKCCIQRLYQGIKVGLEEEWDPGTSQVTSTPPQDLRRNKELTKH